MDHVFSSYRSARDAGDAKLVRSLQHGAIVQYTPLIESCARKLVIGDFDDLIQAGRIGLLRALDKFEPHRGAWSSYARQWILAEMNRGVVEARPQVYGASRWRKPMPKPLRREAEAILAKTGIAATAEDLKCRVEDLEDWTARVTMTEYDDHMQQGAKEEILTRTLLQAMGKLSAIEHRILLKCVVEEKFLWEIAEEEGKHKEWIRLAFLRALRKIRSDLKAPFEEPVTY